MTTRSKTPKSNDDLLKQLRTMVKNAEKMVGDAAESGENGWEHIRDSAKEVYDHLCDNFSHVKESIQEKAEQTDQKIKEHPYSALAVAAGVGILVGLLLRKH